MPHAQADRDRIIFWLEFARSVVGGLGLGAFGYALFVFAGGMQ